MATTDEESIFNAARRIDDAAARQGYLDQACGTDDAVRRRVESLLHVHEQQETFLGSPAIPRPPDDTLEQPASRTPPGTMIGRYKLLEPIGEGGYGTVFMAEQTTPVQRKVALKIIKAGMDTRQVIARFEAERQALALMDHPNIAKVFDAGVTDTGRPYFVMELVKGVSITRYCDEHHLSVQQRVELTASVCHAVQHAHQKGVIHRDIKPTNVLVAEYDGKPVPKIIDFGVAKAVAQRLTERTLFTEFGQIVGTFDYMSPEQAQFNQLDIDTRSDVYSLGVLLYELLVGSTPLEKERLRSAAFAEILRMIGEEEPPPPSTRLSSSRSLASIAANRSLEPRRLTGLISGELDWIVMHCLGKDRNARYGSATEVAADLEHWLHGEPLNVRSLEPGYLLRLWIRRNLGSVGWAIALGLILGAVIGIVSFLLKLSPAIAMPLAIQRAVWWTTALLTTSGGLLTVWLVRPKNVAAEVIAGATCGIVAALTCYTMSWGWLFVGYAGVPLGIWLGMLASIVFMGTVCVGGTCAAGMLLRRYGSLRSIILPYVELITPSTLTTVGIVGIVFCLATGREEWSYYVVPMLLLPPAIISVVWRWNWKLRAIIHAAWLCSVYLFAASFPGP